MANKKLNFIGANLGRGKKASSQINQKIISEGIDIAFIQEPYYYRQNNILKMGGSGAGVYAIYPKDIENPRSCILYNGPPSTCPRLIANLSNRDITVANWSAGGRQFLLVSCYLHAHDNIDDQLASIERSIETNRDFEILIHGDFNARSSELTFDTMTDSRGRSLLDWILKNKMHMLNESGIKTFETLRGSSTIDYTLIKTRHSERWSWCVDENDSLSDHKIINFEIRLDSEITQQTGYKPSRANWNLFKEQLIQTPELNTPNNRQELDRFVENEMTALKKACEKSMKHTTTKLRNCWWWSEKLTQLKKQLNESRNILKRSQNWEGELLQLAVARYAKCRKAYKTEISKSRSAGFKKFCSETNGTDFWEKMKIFTKRRTLPQQLTKMDGTTCKNDAETATEFLKCFFPDAKLYDTVESEDEINETNCNVEDDVAEAISRLPNKKAPGPDGFTGIIMKKYYQIRKDKFNIIAKKCISFGHFPGMWKTATVIPVPKGNGVTTSKGFRPVSLLPLAGKCLEKVFIDQTVQQIKQNGYWSNRQYGFTKGRSTVDAIEKLICTIRSNKANGLNSLVISLDITGAFDNILHSRLIEQMEMAKVSPNLIRFAKSYLTNRFVQIKIGETTMKKKLTRGCPQGSKCGPGMFNIVLNDLLRRMDELDLECIAYADDIILIVSGKDNDLMKSKANNTLEMITDWGQENGLKFNEEKTQAMMFRKSKKVKWPQISMNEKKIAEQKSIKYLGVIVENNLKWNAHLRAVQLKALNAMNVCFSMIGYKWGLPLDLRKRIYNCIILPISTYAGPIWNEALRYDYARSKMKNIEQIAISRILRCKRTSNHFTLMYLSNLKGIEECIWGLMQKRQAKQSGNDIMTTIDEINLAHEQIQSERYNSTPDHFKELMGLRTEIKTSSWANPMSMQVFMKNGLNLDFRIKCPFCDTEGKLTYSHLLFECSSLTLTRNAILSTCGINTHRTLFKVLSEEETCRKFNIYCEILHYKLSEQAQLDQIS